MRPIDADALMKELEREVELADDWKTAHEIANCVKYAPTIGGWISVKDDTPVAIQEPAARTEHRPVLLYAQKDHSFYVGWYLHRDYRGVDCYIARKSMGAWQYIIHKITHWMPLPEPPKEDV